MGPATTHVLEEVARERGRQDKRWGGEPHDDSHTPGTWSVILATQFGKVMREVHGFTFGGEWKDREPYRAPLRERLIQLAATAVAWVETLDRERDQ